jgi:pre-mRNA-splicing factor ISY1
VTREKFVRVSESVGDFYAIVPRAAGLGESRIRDLNDEINKLMREKFHWERQIRALGGPDYIASAPRSYDADGRELPGTRGYRYFGAAKDLPGVKELFDTKTREAARRTRGEIMRDITPDYYGYRDDDDGVLVAAEAAAEQELLAVARSEWETAEGQRKRSRQPDGAATGSGDSVEDDEDHALSAADAIAFADTAFRAHVPVPTQADIERALLDRKKALLQQSLFEKYASPALQAEQRATALGGPSGGAAPSE